MFAIIPVEKKTNKNLLLPIKLSKTNPNKIKANKLKIRCVREPCKKIAVTNLQTSGKDCWFNNKESVKLGIIACKIKTAIIIKVKSKV